MANSSKRIRKNLIHFLSGDEARDPILYLRDHFTFANLNEHYKLLKDWYNDTLYTKSKSHSSPSNTLYYYEVTLKFVEACWMIKKHKPNLGNRSSIFLNTAFEDYDLDRYKDVLREWLFASLSISKDSDDLSYERVCFAYHGLLQLNEMAFIIVYSP